MRRWLGVATLGLGVALWALTRPQGLDGAEQAAIAAHMPDPDNGARVFWAAGCAGCHAAPGLDAMSPPEARLVLSGGRRFDSDFGTFLAPNISMDPVQGIGGWTQAQFADAVLMGVSPGGQHYYPRLSLSPLHPHDARRSGRSLGLLAGAAGRSHAVTGA